MRRLFYCLALLLLAGISSVRAEIRVSIECDRANYLLYAPVVVRVIIQNITEQDIILQSGDESWLSFVVLRTDGFAVRPDQKIISPPLMVKAGETKSVVMDLTPHYAFREPGNFKACAVVDVPGQGQILSGNLQFNVNRGQTVLTRTRPTAGSDRTFTILKFSPDNTSTELYLRVDDTKENLVYATIDLGPITSTVLPPQVTFDKEGSFHVLHTMGQGSYRYNRVREDGTVETRRNYDAAPEMPPRLVLANDGAVMVVGGQVQDDDNRRDRLSEAKFGKADAKPQTPADKAADKTAKPKP